MAVKASSNVPARKRGKAIRHSSRLEAFHNLPDYLKDNEFILSSYRNQLTVWESIKTAFVWVAPRMAPWLPWPPCDDRC